MSQTAVLVWISAVELLPAFRPELDALGRARLLRWEAPRPNASAAASARAYAPDQVDQIEALLDEARTRTASLDAAAAADALTQADALLHAHPELPQAAWLMAERLQLGADQAATLSDAGDSVAELRARARVLEGAPRAEPFSDATIHAAALPPLVEQPLEIDGLEPGDTLEWDDAESTTTLHAAAGEHHARVLRGERLIWAGWVSVTPGAERLRLPVPATLACSPDDLAGAGFAGARPIAPTHARCSSYALARARPGGGIELAFCAGNQCEAPLIWFGAAQPAPPAERGWPTWATVTLAGAGALAATAIALSLAGVLDRPEPRTSTTWVYTGIDAAKTP